MANKFLKTFKSKSRSEAAALAREQTRPSLWQGLVGFLEQWFLAALALAFVLGVATIGVLGLPPRLLLPLLLCAGGLFVLLVLLRRYHFLLLVAFLLGCFWCGIQLANLENLPAVPGRTMVLTGTVTEVNEGKRDYLNNISNSGEAAEDNRTSFVFQATEKGAWRGKIMAFAEDYQVKVGDRLELKAIVLEEKAYNNWLSGKSDHYLRDHGIAGMAEVTPGGLSFLDLERQNPAKALAATAKEKLYENLYENLKQLPQLQQEFIKGIAFGDKSGLSGYQMQVLSQTGIIHIFAVSGLHIGFVVLFALALANLLGKLPRFGAKCKFLFVVLLTLFYGCITGFTPSVFRATVMSLAAAFALLFGETNNSKATILYAAFLCLLPNPLLLFDIGFQLSFLATAGIVYTKEVWAAITKWQPLQLTLSAEFAVIPLTAYHFSVVTLVGLLLSPLAAAGAGLVVVMVLLALPLMLIGLGDIPLYGAGLVTEFLFKGAEVLNKLPASSFTIVKPGLGILCCYFICLLTGYYFLTRYQRSVNTLTSQVAVEGGGGNG